jgi:bifunctional DNase/RNase
VVSRLIKLRVTEVRLAVPASVGVEAGMIVLTEDIPPGRALRIIIGQPEARAIHAAWDGSIPSRANTWDLFVSAIALLGGRIDRAVITGVEQERHYFARIEMEQDGEHRTLSCRPSDAVALALRSYEAGIFAEEAVLDEAGVLPDGTKPGRSVPTNDAPEPVAPAVPIDPAEARERELAEREAALAARERELAEREAWMGGPSPIGDAVGDPGLAVGVDQVVADGRPTEAGASAVGNPPAGAEQPDHP